MPARKSSRQIEKQEQDALVEWFRMAYPDCLLFAIPNQLVRGPYQGASMVRGGLVVGMPDLMLAVGNKTYHGLFVEMKRPARWDCKAGELSVAQQDILRRLNDAGYLALVCYGFDDAQRAIVDYMS